MSKDHGSGEAADFGEIPNGLKALAKIARKFGLKVTSGPPISGYRTAEEQRLRRSAIWPEVHDHYDHHGPRGSYHQPPPSKGLWQTPPTRMEPKFYDPIENAEMAQRQLEFYRQYMRARYGTPPVERVSWPLESEATCEHFTPSGIECPWCE